jgi:hypothetical protein
MLKAFLIKTAAVQLVLLLIYLAKYGGRECIKTVAKLLHLDMTNCEDR